MLSLYRQHFASWRMCTGSIHMRLFRRQVRFVRSFHYTPAWAPLVRAPDAGGSRCRALELGQLDVQRAHAQLAGAGLAELAAAGGVGALDAAAAIGAFGRQHEQGDAAPLAGGLEPGHGLAAAVDPHRLEVERRLADQAVEESCGASGRGARVGAHAAKLRDRAHRLGLLDREAGLDGDAHMIDPDHLAGLSPAVAAAPALSVAVELAPPLGLGAHQAGDHAPGGGLAGREAAPGAPARARRHRLARARTPCSRPQGAIGRTARDCRSARRPAAKVRRGSRRYDRICGAYIRFAWRFLPPFGCWICIKHYAASKIFAHPHISDPGQMEAVIQADDLKPHFRQYAFQYRCWTVDGVAKRTGTSTNSQRTARCLRISALPARSRRTIACTRRRTSISRPNSRKCAMNRAHVTLRYYGFAGISNA